MTMIVTWSIMLDGCDDPERAAMLALEVIRDLQCGVQTFQVVEVGDDGEALGAPIEIALETLPPATLRLVT